MAMEETNLCSGHEGRIQALEHSVSRILTEVAVSNERLNTISKQLENGIKLRLDTLTRDMAKILPVIEKDMKKESAVEIAVAIAIKTTVVGGILSVFGAILMFVIKIYFTVHG